MFEHLPKQQRYTLLAVIVTIAGSLLYLFYAAWRGWIATDTLTLIITVLNSALLIFVLKRSERAHGA